MRWQIGDLNTRMRVRRKSKAHRDELYEKEQTWARQHQDLRRGHEDTLAQYEAKESRAMAHWRSQHENASAAQIKAHRDELYEKEQTWARQHERLRLGHEDKFAQYEAKESRAMANWRSQHENASAAQIKAHRDELYEKEQTWARQCVCVTCGVCEQRESCVCDLNMKMRVRRKSKFIEMNQQTWARQHQDLRRGHADTLAQYEAKERRDGSAISS